MPLTPADKNKLSNHCSNNKLVYNLVPGYGDETDYTTLETWFNSVPEGEYINFMWSMPVANRKAFFKIAQFRGWYADICDKIQLDTMTAMLGMSQQDYADRSLDLLKFDLSDNNLLQLPLVDFMYDMVNRQTYRTLVALAELLGGDDVFNIPTVKRIRVEFNLPDPEDTSTPVTRWESIGMTIAPTAAEIETEIIALGTPNLL